MTEILVIDDDLGDFKPGLLHALKGYRLHFAYSGRDGLKVLDEHPGTSLVLLDVKMPCDFADTDEREGIKVLKKLKAEYPNLPVVMLTVLADVDLIVEAIQAGAFHYVTKPIDRDKLRTVVGRAIENATLKQRLTSLSRARDAVLAVHGTASTKKRTRFHDMIGGSTVMQHLYDQIERAAPFEEMNVVLLGETGSGKDLAARAIHACSPRRKGPFVAVNCAALQETMLEAELFGHEKGAFTSADEKREGLFVHANGGTLLLDEIGEMSPALQTKVLRAIETKEVRPVGGTPVTVDVRIICATNIDLGQAKESGAFREDLYYRIWDIPLTLPPLRQRKEDIPFLARHFLKECADRNQLDCTVDPGAIEALAEHDWPGNVRELAGTIRRLAVFADKDCISEHQVRKLLGLPARSGVPESALSEEPVEISDEEPGAAPGSLKTKDDEPLLLHELPEIADLGEYLRLHGEIRLKEVLERAISQGGNARKAMALLGMPQDRYDAFRKWLQRLGIRVRDLKKD